MLDKQINLFTVTTSAFLNEEEKEISQVLIEKKREIKDFKEELKEIDKSEKQSRKKIKEIEEEIEKKVQEIIEEEKEEKGVLEEVIEEEIKKIIEKEKYIVKEETVRKEEKNTIVEEIEKKIKEIEEEEKESAIRLNTKKEIEEILEEKEKELKIQTKEIKEVLKEKFKENLKWNDRNKENKKIRKLDKNYIEYIDKNGEIKPNLNNIISMFASDLSRSFGVKTNELTRDIIVVDIYYYDLGQDLIVNGFNLDEKQYVYFSSSAGQIRTKKAVFVKEEVFEKVKGKLMCGLTIEHINQQGGMNTNKFLAYLALCNSATELWHDIFNKDFDIDRCIVVDDFETSVKGLADHIDYQSYTITQSKQDSFTIPHTDGCGIISKDYTRKNFMVRLPFMKGLLASFDFKRFCKENNTSKIVDMWGKQYDVFEDNIEIILTKSMFKLHKYYASWEDYKQKYKSNNCSANVCNIEEDYIKNARINYQMLQTLYKMTDEEISKLVAKSNYKIERISESLENMLDIFGIRKNKTISQSNYFNQALSIYPELMHDIANKNTLRELKQSLVHQYKAGKIEIQGKFTFVLPDLYGFCEKIFLGNNNPMGLIGNGEVFCSLYPNAEEVDCLRSPSLYIEHPVRSNVYNKKRRNQKLNEWFTTKAIYISNHDLISRYLQLDKHKCPVLWKHKT